ncbi:MAG: cupin domain-containing protein [Pseudomonadota bacterium]
MHANIIDNSGCPAFLTEERCEIEELSNGSHDEGLSVARASVAPGITTAWHILHQIDERYVIQSGTGDVEVGDLPLQRVYPGDVVVIPAGVRQRIHNPDSNQALVFLALCTPRFKAAAYESLEL